MKLKERLRNIFLNNIGLKLGSLATAVVLWFVITNTSNPTTQRQYSNIPVRFTNTDTITDQGEVITVLDGTDTVSTVTVRAPRSVIDVLESDNIVATADARNLTDDGTIPITFMTNRYYSQVESIKASSYNVKVSVEAEMSKTMQLKAYATGTPEEGYVVGDVTLDQNQIRVSGPQSVVSQISEARANVDVTGATGSITTNVDIVLLDSEGGEIDTSTLTMNITSVKITANILPEKEVGISASYTGTPAKGYLANGEVTVSPATVRIAAKSSILNDISSIQIPADAIDISGASEDVSATVDISEYLPDGARFADSSFDGNVTVTVGIEKTAEKDLKVTMDDFAITNVPDGYTASFVSISDSEDAITTQSMPETLTLKISGLQSTLDAVTKDDFTFTYDFDALISGSANDNISGIYTADAAITAPAGVTYTGGFHAAIRLSSEQDSSEDS